MIRLYLLAICLPLFASCSGYQLGHTKPTHLQAIKRISVPLVKNNTQEPRLESLATNAIVDAITRDGTYKIARDSAADATLKATITKLSYSESRSQRFDTLRPDKLTITITLKWKLIQNGVVLDSGTSEGESNFFIERNEQRSRENSFPDTVRNAARNLVSRIANGF